MSETESGDRAANLKSIIEQLNANPAAAATGGDLSSRDKRARSTARLASVQALYQMELSGVGVETVIREFSDHRFDVDEDGVSLPRADEAFFQDLLRSVVKDQNAIDRAISERLAADWRLDRLDATLRAILRAGVFELLHRKDIGVEIVIDEYVELTKAFFTDVEAKFVNACLDGVRRDQPA